MVSFGKGSSGGGGNVWSQQAPFLQSLYGGVQNLANYQTGGGFQQAQPSASAGAPAGRNVHGSFQPWPGQQQGAPGMTNYQGSTQQPGAAGGSPWGPYASAAGGLSQSLFSGANPWVQGQINNLGQNLGNFYNQQLLPGINQQSSFYGGTGGGRQGVAQGLAAQGVAQQFQQGANNIYAQSLQNAPDLFNLGMAPWQAQWEPYRQMAGLLGSPTVLGQGTSGGFNFGFLN